MVRTRKLIGLAAIAAALAAAGLAHAQATWKPTKPITIIVPWAAGGSTDQVTRITAAEIEKALGQKVVIVNTPGASGSIGTKSAMDAPKDGYTWTAGAAKDLGTYKVLGMLDTTISDWVLFLNVANVSTLSVNPNTPYKTVNELIDAMRAKPGQISVATAGVNSSGHSAMEAIARAAGVKYKHVTYDGGNPAVVATVAGETDATTQLTVEQAEMIRGKRLRPLAVVGDKPVELDGFGTIEPLTKSMPALQGAGQLLRHLHPEERAAGSDRHRREDLDRQHQQLEGAQGVRDEQGRAVRAGRRRRRDEGRDAGRAGQRVAGVRRRQGEGLARHARHRAAVEPSGGRRAGRHGRQALPTLRPRHRRRLGRARASPSRSAPGAWTASSRRACRGSRRPGLLPGIVGVGIVLVRAHDRCRARCARSAREPGRRAPERPVAARAAISLVAVPRLRRGAGRARRAVHRCRGDLPLPRTSSSCSSRSAARPARSRAARSSRSPSRSSRRRAISLVFQEVFLVRLP